jgi:hypothetical protein
MPKIKKTGIVVVPSEKKSVLKTPRTEKHTREQMKKLQGEFKKEMYLSPRMSKINPRMSKKEQDLLKELMMKGKKSNPVPSKPKTPKTPKKPKKPKNQMKKRNLIYREKSVLQKQKRSRGV